MTTKLRHFTAAVLVILLLVACDKAPDEEVISQHIASMKEAVEMNEFAEIKDHLHESFIANNRLNAREVNQLLRMYSRQHKNIGVTVITSKTTMDTTYPDRAESILSVVVTGSSGRLPTDGSVRTVKLAWIKQSGDWYVIRAEWERY